MQHPLKRIVVATDFSDSARTAVRRAGWLAERHGAALCIVHALAAAGWVDGVVGVVAPVKPLSLQAAIATALDAECAHLPASVQARTTTGILEGSLHRSLAAFLAQEPADLVVLGARGSSGWRGMLLGSTAERWLRECRQPTLLVRPPMDGDYRKVALATDFSAVAQAAAAYGMHLVGPARFVLVHVDEGSQDSSLALVGSTREAIDDYRRQRAHAAMSRLEALAERLSNAHTSVVPVLREAPAARAFTELVEAMDVDLVVAGACGSGQQTRQFLGSISHHLAVSLPCDVLVV